MIRLLTIAALLCWCGGAWGENLQCGPDKFCDRGDPICDRLCERIARAAVTHDAEWQRLHYHWTAPPMTCDTISEWAKGAHGGYGGCYGTRITTGDNVITNGGSTLLNPGEEASPQWPGHCEPGWELVIRLGPAPKEGIFKDSIGHWGGLACAWVVKDAIR